MRTVMNFITCSDTPRLRSTPPTTDPSLCRIACAPVETTHRRAPTMVQPPLDGSSRLFEHLIQHRKLLLGHRRRQIPLAARLDLSSIPQRRLPDANADPHPLFRAQH